MGKKSAKKVIKPSDPRPDDEADDPYDSDAEAEAAALADLEAEREAEAAEWDGGNDDDGAGGGGGRGKVVYNREGLLAAVAELEARELPWLERLDMVAEEKAELPDVHDDLAREMCFYEQALAAAKGGRDLLKGAGVSWKRPEDFFCEMVKSDSHMARVKDRLIFEQHKMDAFEKRKQRQTQAKFAKARGAELVQQKAAEKRENIEAVDKWREQNKDRRKGGLGDDDDRDMDKMLAARDEARDSAAGQSRKRKNSDRKWGFGGEKNKKSTRNDEKALNNTRGFNPKKMKAAASAVKQYGKGGGKGGKGGGKSRPGKDSRDKGRGRG